MFKEGRLLYFEPFFFKNGNLPKNKYFLVIKDVDGELLLASLPTSQDHIPQGMDIRNGIYEIPNSRLSAFVFIAGKEIATHPSTKRRFSFSKNTFIYAEELDTYPESFFIEQVSQGKTKISIIGDIDKPIYDDIVSFLHGSCTIRRKYRKLL